MLRDMTVIRGTALQGYLELVAELGADPNVLLSAAGIPPRAVGDCEEFLSFRAVVHAVEMAARATQSADFGRRLALRQGLEILGPLAAAARTSATTGQAFQALHRYLALYSPAIAASLEHPAGDGLARFECRIVIDDLPPHRQVVELAIGVALRITRLILGRAYAPVSVHLSHAPMAPSEEYRRYFGCPVVFAEPFSGFLVRPEDMARPLASDAAVRAVVKAYLDSLTPALGGTVSGSVRMLVQQLLHTGTADRELIAGHLSMHPRTLQRRLAAEGTTFAAVTDSVRRAEAERYLRDTDVPLTQLSAYLGYATQSVFTRACHRWFGRTGAAHRRSTRRTIL